MSKCNNECCAPEGEFNNVIFKITLHDNTSELMLKVLIYGSVPEVLYEIRQ